MTLLTTHIAIEALVVWLLMGQKNRTIFKNKLGLFTMLTLFAAFPDLDTFFYIHRTYLHSIIWPLAIILGVLSYLSYMKWIKKSNFTDKSDLICRSFILVSVFLILHSFLDLNPGPVLLFFPFDNRLYSWNVSVIWDLDSFFYIKELKFKWISISLNEGLSSFPLFNLTPVERIQYFGAEYLEIFIGEFPIHFLTSLAWLVFFPGMAIIVWLKKRQKPLNFFKKAVKFRNPLIAIGLILLSLGIIIGPGYKLNRTEIHQSSHLLTFSETQVNFGIARGFELDKNDILTVKGVYAGNTTFCDIYAVISGREHFQRIDDELTRIFGFYENKTQTYSWLISNYLITVQSFLDGALIVYPISQNTTEGISYTLNQTESLHTVILLTNWNVTTSFSTEVLMTSVLFIKRIFEFSFGMTIASLGIIITTFSIILSAREIKKESKEIVAINENP